VVDAEKFERILLNLLSNAFKFTPAGGRVRCALERSGENRCLLMVQDSGPGVPPELREAIFERFRQGQQGTTRPHGGSGLGLAIAKEFVELHGGAIGVSAAPGSGALFQVELPLAPPPGSYVAPAPAPPAGEGDDAALRGVLSELALDDAVGEEAVPPAADRSTVLLVEDNAEMRRFVRDALAGDHRVIAVADGQVALERAMAEPPDLVVTDLMLPGLGGDKLVEAMRAAPRLADVPVLVLSARDDRALRARLLAQAAQDYLTKPFSAHELRARVRNLATMKRARDALRRELLSQSNDLTHLTRHLIASRRALQESERRWWAIYEHSPVGIALIDADGHVRSANPAFRAMLDYSAEEIRACSLAQITPPEDRAATRERLAQLLAGEVHEYHVQRRYLRRDGSPVWTSTSVARAPDAAGDAPLLVVVAEDIGEQKRAEQELLRARGELAQVTRASTLGELAASIAHEVNQPLAAIAANAQAAARWLDARPADEREARAALQRIVRDATRAGDVITRIRGFLQRGEIRRAPVGLEAAVRDVLELAHAEAQNRGVALHVEADEVLPPVLADRVQLQQVVLNLVMNGMEAIARAPDGERRVGVTLRRDGAGALRVQVRDTGAGLDPADGERIFQAFQTSKPDGMGMGLAISRSIVESHGGRLWVESTNGSGATFSFTLPLAMSGDSALRRTMHWSSSSTTTCRCARRSAA
jgi:PAS domain S-box-containing protein